MIIGNLFNQVELVNIKKIVEIVTFQKLGTVLNLLIKNIKKGPGPFSLPYFYEIAALRSQ